MPSSRPASLLEEPEAIWSSTSISRCVSSSRPGKRAARTLDTFSLACRRRQASMPRAACSCQRRKGRASRSSTCSLELRRSIQRLSLTIRLGAGMPAESNSDRSCRNRRDSKRSLSRRSMISARRERSRPEMSNELTIPSTRLRTNKRNNTPQRNTNAKTQIGSAWAKKAMIAATPVRDSVSASGLRKGANSIAGAEPHADRRSARTPDRTSSPSSARSSRRSMRGESSRTASCLWRASSIAAGMSSQEASVLSPAAVRVVDINSNSPPLPKMSKSSA